MTTVIRRDLDMQRLLTILLGAFATSAMLLAAVGLYGLIAYAAVRRRKEVGIRMALGATASRVVQSFVGEGVTLASIGLLLGLAGAAAVTRLLDVAAVRHHAARPHDVRRRRRRAHRRRDMRITDSRVERRAEPIPRRHFEVISVTLPASTDHTMTVRRALRLVILAAVAARTGDNDRLRRIRRGRSGAVRTATSCPTARAWPRPGRRADRRSCGAGGSAKDIPRCSSRTDASTRCTGRSRGSRRSHMRKSSPRSMPRLARRSGSSNTPSSPNGIQFDQGFGPHSTPLIVGNRLFAASSRSELFALDKTTGKRIWSHDFVKEFNAPLTGRGYSGSPLLYNGTIIVTMGGANQAVAAFDQASGKLLWKNGYFVWAPASPILIDVDKQPQLVVFGGDVVTGMDPANGRELWRHPHKTDWGLNITTPVWVADQHLLLVSSAYGVGTRALELRQSGGKTTVTEKWHSQRMRVHIGTVIPSRRARVWLERRLRSGVHLGDRSEERRDCLAGPQFRAGPAALRRRQGHRARRRRRRSGSRPSHHRD